MFEKVLIAEDYESTSLSVIRTLEELRVPASERVYYCDDALLRIRKELASGKAFDLLITDLSFDEDHRSQHIQTGRDLIREAKKVQPGLKTLIFSVENRLAVARELAEELGIDGFVPKGRQDAQDLQQALSAIAKGNVYLSRKLRDAGAQGLQHQFTELDQAIIYYLADGRAQKQIPGLLKQRQIAPNSLSSVEKRLAQIRNTLGFSKNEQLIAYCKDKYPHFFKEISALN